MRWQWMWCVSVLGGTAAMVLVSMAPAIATSLRPMDETKVKTETEGVIERAAEARAAETRVKPTAERLIAPLQAQAPPAAPDDRFLQPLPVPIPLPEPDTEPVAPVVPPEPAPLPAPAETQIPVQQIQVVGSTVFEEADFAPLVAPFEGRSLTLEELRTVADVITQLYLNQGYLTSRAVLPAEQVITNGVVQIQVIEGTLEQIEVEGVRQLNPAYVRNRIALGAGTPLNQARLEDQLRLLRLDPLFDNVEASLRAGTGIGQSILTVRVTEANPWFGSASVDNYSPPSVGSERLGISLGNRNLTGRGDELFGSYFRSTTGGSNVYELGYRLPLNPMEGTLQLRAAPSNFEITDSVIPGLSIEGSAELYELSYRQPLIRSPREEFALSLGLTYRDGETLIGGFLIDQSTTSVIRFGQDYVRRDVRGAWAARSQFNLGTDWFDATNRPSPDPDGQFFSWVGQLQRVQILNPDNLLILQADVQLSPDGLLPSQQFVIGGGQSLRGYRQNIRSGDNGFRLSVEDRITLQRNAAGLSTLQLAPFADAGAVWNADDNPNALPDQTFLAGVGLGVLWEPIPLLNIRADFTLPLVNLRDRGTNAQDDGFYFSVVYRF